MKHKFLSISILFLLIFSINFYSFAANSSLQLVDSNNTLNDVQTNEQTNNDISINAEACSLLDVDSGKFLFEKNASKKMYPASTTKLLTALVVLDKCSDLTQKANVSYYSVHSIPYSYSIANLHENESFTINELLHALLIASANDAAYVLAEYIANNGNNYPTDSVSSSKAKFDASIETFANMMNEKATSLGCTGSHFVNPNGIHNENCYTTAHDLALIGKSAYNIQTIRDIVDDVKYELPHTSIFGEDRIFQTTNTLLRKDKKTYYQYANGLKTGYTDSAKSCIIASAKKDNRNLIAVVLGGNTGHNDDSRDADCKKLFEYGFNNYSLSQLVSANDVVKHLTILNGTKETNELDVYCNKSLGALIKTGEVLDVTPEININKSLAPIVKGEVIGTIKYTVDGTDYQADLIASHDVYASSYKNILIILLILFITFLFFLILISKPKKRKTKKHMHSHSRNTKNHFNHNKYMY